MFFIECQPLCNIVDDDDEMLAPFRPTEPNERQATQPLYGDLGQGTRLRYVLPIHL